MGFQKSATYLVDQDCQSKVVPLETQLDSKKSLDIRENEIRQAADKIKSLMVELDHLIRSTETEIIKGLVKCTNAIAKTSNDLAKLAKTHADLCANKEIRNNILQASERIPTMGTQLRILSTVKMSMFGAHGPQVDQEAVEMIAGNAVNLIRSVQETVEACGAVSIMLKNDQTARANRWILKDSWLVQVI